MQCPYCNQEHPEGTLFCPMSGKKIVLPKRCPQCGKPVDISWLHCGYCGQELIQENEAPIPKSTRPGGYPQSPQTKSEILKTNRKASKVPWLIIAVGMGVLLIAATVLLITFLKGTNPGVAAPIMANSSFTANIPSGDANVKEVNAMTFLTAFQEGKADPYIGFTVKGEGREFSNYLMGAAPQGPLNLTLGTIGPDNKITILQSWEEWSSAEAEGQPMLMLQLSGSNFARKGFNPSEMPVYAFAGRYMGETVSQMQLVYKTGQEPAFFLVPVLVDGVVK
jgi:hypothetical protein